MDNDTHTRARTHTNTRVKFCPTTILPVLPDEDLSMKMRGIWTCSVFGKTNQTLRRRQVCGDMLPVSKRFHM